MTVATDLAEVRPHTNARSNDRGNRQHHASQITRCWRKAWEGIIETGQLLQRAKDGLPRGEFGQMFERHEVPFGQDQAERLMAIARHPIISNSAHARNFPASVHTLFLLTRLPDNVLRAMLADGRMRPELERKDIERIRKSLKAAPGALQELLAKLRIVEPALADIPIVPLLTKFWFTGEHLMAHNDNIALAVPFATNFKGALSGQLRALLPSAGFDNSIAITATADEVLIRNGAADNLSMTLTLDRPVFPFVMPAANRSRSQGIAPLVEAIDYCLPSIGTDVSEAEYLGVTIEPDGDLLHLYASDGGTLSYATCPNDVHINQRIILLRDFCTQIVRLFHELDDRNDVAFSACGNGDSVASYALFRAGDVMLYGRNLEGSRRYGEMVQGRLLNRRGFAPIPEGLAKAAGVAEMVSRRNSLVTVRSGRLSIRAQSDQATVEKVLPIGGHPDISVRVQAGPLRRADHFNQMLITDDAIIMKDQISRFYVVFCLRETD